MNRDFKGGIARRKIDGHYFYPMGYEGRAAKVKQRYFQEQGQRTRIIEVGGRSVLFVASGRQRRRK